MYEQSVYRVISFPRFKVFKIVYKLDVIHYDFKKPHHCNNENFVNILKSMWCKLIAYNENFCSSMRV